MKNKTEKLFQCVVKNSEEGQSIGLFLAFERQDCPPSNSTKTDHRVLFFFFLFETIATKN